MKRTNLILTAALVLVGVSAQAAINYASPTYSVITKAQIDAVASANLSAINAASVSIQLGADTDGTLIISYDPASADGILGGYYDIDPFTGTGTQIVTEPTIVAQSATIGETDYDDTGFVVDSNGDIYMIDTEQTTGKEIFKITRSSSTVTRLGTGTYTGFNTSLAYDGSSTLYYGDSSTDQFFSFPKTGGTESVFQTATQIGTGTGTANVLAADGGPVSAEPGGGGMMIINNQSAFGGDDSIRGITTPGAAYSTIVTGAALTAAGAPANPQIEDVALAQNGAIAGIGDNVADPNLYVIEPGGTIHQFTYASIQAATSEATAIDNFASDVAIYSSASLVWVAFANHTTGNIIVAKFTDPAGVEGWDMY